MKVKTHRLENVFQHKKIEIVLSGTLCGVIGPIGSGKSNLLRSLGANLHSEWESKWDRVMTLGEKTCSVETRLTVRPGLDLTVSRDIKRKKASLKFSDGRPDIEGSDAVSSSLLSELGVDKSILREVVFVGQNSINDLLFAPDSAKDRLAAKFFGIDRTVTIEKDLSGRINEIFLTTLAESSAELRGKLHDAKSRKESWVEELSRAGSADAERLAILQRHLAAYLVAGKQNEDRKEYLRDKRDLESTIHKYETSNQILEESIAAIPIERLRQRLSEESEKARKWDIRQRLSKDVAKFTAELSRIGSAPYTDAHLEELRSEILRLSKIENVNTSLLQSRKTLIDDIREPEVIAICPLCESELGADDHDRLCHLVEKSQIDQANKNRVEALKQQEHAELNIWNDWSQKRHTASSRLQEGRQELEALGPDEGPGDPSKWEQNLASYDSMREDLSEGVRELQETRERLSKLVEPSAGVSGYPDGFNATAAQVEILEIQAQQGSIASVTQELRLVEQELVSLEGRLFKAQEIESENLIQTKLRASLVRIRARFHPDGAPRDLVGRRIQRMEEKINKYLSLLESKFSVTACGGFNFEAVFPDKPGAIWASELSGGEKASLSIAFRLAAVETFSASVGLLVLDEPTAAFPRESIEHFGKVLERLKVIGPQLGMQFLVISHSTELIEHFDQLIDLTPQ